MVPSIYTPISERSLQLSQNYAQDRNEEEVTISLEKARMYAYSYIPADATVEEARGWLIGQIDRRRHSLSSADLGYICRVHSEDYLVLEWRVGVASPSTFVPGSN